MYSIYARLFGKTRHLEDPLEAGRRMGVMAHRKLMYDMNLDEPAIVDDRQLTRIINHVVPKDLTRQDTRDWRAGFLEGWMSL